MSNPMQDETETGKEMMRGLIHTGGVGKAVATVADMYAAPANYTEHDRLAGMLLAAYEAGLVKGMQLSTDLIQGGL